MTKTGRTDRLRGRTILEIANTLYGEKGAMAALARGLNISPGYLGNIAAGLKPMTETLSIKLVLLCRREIEANLERNAGIEVLLADIGDIKLGEE